MWAPWGLPLSQLSSTTIEWVFLESLSCSQFLVLSAPFPKRMCVHFFAPNQIASHEDCHVFSEWTPLALDMSVVRARICKELSYTVRLCGSSDSQLDSSILLSWNKWKTYIKTVWDEFANLVYGFVVEMKIMYLNNFSFSTLKKTTLKPLYKAFMWSFIRDFFCNWVKR